MLEQLPLLLLTVVVVYPVMIAASVLVTCVLYVCSQFLPNNIRARLILEPKRFIVHQSVVFPIYFFVIFFATLPLSEKDYRFAFYVGLYIVLLFLYLAGFQVVSKYLDKKRALSQ